MLSSFYRSPRRWNCRNLLAQLKPMERILPLSFLARTSTLSSCAFPKDREISSSARKSSARRVGSDMCKRFPHSQTQQRVVQHFLVEGEVGLDFAHAVLFKECVCLTRDQACAHYNFHISRIEIGQHKRLCNSAESIIRVFYNNVLLSRERKSENRALGIRNDHKINHIQKRLVHGVGLVFVKTFL